MTLALAFIGSDGVVMATDSANTIIESGRVVDTILMKKLYLIGNRTGLAVMSLQAGVSQWMIDQFEPTIKGVGVDVSKLQFSEAVHLFTGYANEYIGRYTRGVPIDALRSKATQIAFILGGYNQGKASIIQSISTSAPNLFAPDLIPNGRCYLGVREETLYWVHKIEQSGIEISALDTVALKRLCAFLIQETSDRDPDYVRVPVQMLTIAHNSDANFVPDYELEELNRAVSRVANQDKILRVLGLVNHKNLDPRRVNPK